MFILFSPLQFKGPALRSLVTWMPVLGFIALLGLFWPTSAHAAADTSQPAGRPALPAAPT